MHIIRFDDNYRIKSKLIVLDDLDELDAIPIKQWGEEVGGKEEEEEAGCHFKLANPLIRFEARNSASKFFPLILQILPLF